MAVWMIELNGFWSIHGYLEKSFPRLLKYRFLNGRKTGIFQRGQTMSFGQKLEILNYVFLSRIGLERVRGLLMFYIENKAF